MKKWNNLKKKTLSLVLQFKGLVPDRVEAALDGLRLLFALTPRVWDQFQLHVGVWQPIGVHRNQIPALFNCRKNRECNRETLHISEVDSLVFIRENVVWSQPTISHGAQKLVLKKLPQNELNFQELGYAEKQKTNTHTPNPEVARSACNGHLTKVAISNTNPSFVTVCCRGCNCIPLV